MLLLDIVVGMLGIEVLHIFVVALLFVVTGIVLTVEIHIIYHF